MEKIKVNLLGTPRVLKDDEEIIFPYGKAEAIFYYLIVEKQATREKLCQLFWDDISYDTAKKNLRNAIYLIRKSLDKNILISPRRSIIKLNSQANIEADVEYLTSEEDIEKNEKSFRNLRNKDFLEGFVLKNADNFQEWIFSTRDYYKELHIKKIHVEIEKCLRDGDLKIAEQFCKKLISIDEFDESAYRSLMNIYKTEKRYDKCLEIYNELLNTFQRELSIVPDKETRDLFKEIVAEKEKNSGIKKKKSKKFFYGRTKVLSILDDNINNFLKDRKAKSFAIIGEVGVGKTALMERTLELLDRDEMYVFSSVCYRAEKEFLLKPWHRIFKQFYSVIDEDKIEIPPLINKVISYAFPRFEKGNMKIYNKLVELADFLRYQVVEQGVIDVFLHLAQNKKIVIFIDDIQWIDYMSLKLLKNMLIQIHNQEIIFLITCRNSYNKNIEDFFTEMGMYSLIDRLRLERFNADETLEFFNSLVGQDNSFTKEIESILYNETKGNALFLINLVDNLLAEKDVSKLSPMLQDIIESRLLDVSEEGLKLLDIISVFPDRVTIGYLKEILGNSEMEILDVVEELLQRNLLREVKDLPEIGFELSHPKLKKYIYSKLSFAKKRLLSSRIDAMTSKR
ncbi:AAA family ATPase [Wukongibacter baidiensis]|uniref:AAA family ATPase n=1 Tax=Wukongibacter baidiensis TaxID=1723361 RepID=UPI003D7F853B